MEPETEAFLSGYNGGVIEQRFQLTTLDSNGGFGPSTQDNIQSDGLMDEPIWFPVDPGMELDAEELAHLCAIMDPEEYPDYVPTEDMVERIMEKASRGGVAFSTRDARYTHDREECVRVRNKQNQTENVPVEAIWAVIQTQEGCGNIDCYDLDKGFNSVANGKCGKVEFVFEREPTEIEAVKGWFSSEPEPVAVVDTIKGWFTSEPEKEQLVVDSQSAEKEQPVGERKKRRHHRKHHKKTPVVKCDFDDYLPPANEMPDEIIIPKPIPKTNTNEPVVINEPVRKVKKEKKSRDSICIIS